MKLTTKLAAGAAAGVAAYGVFQVIKQLRAGAAGPDVAEKVNEALENGQAAVDATVDKVVAAVDQILTTAGDKIDEIVAAANKNNDGGAA